MVHEKASSSFAANTRPYLNPTFPNRASGVFPIHVGALNEMPPHMPNSFRRSLASLSPDVCAALSGTARRSTKNNKSVSRLRTSTQRWRSLFCTMSFLSCVTTSFGCYQLRRHKKHIPRPTTDTPIVFDSCSIAELIAVLIPSPRISEIIRGQGRNRTADAHLFRAPTEPWKWFEINGSC